MNRKAMIENCVQYILDQNHEREDLVNSLIWDIKDRKDCNYTKAEIRHLLMIGRENYIYWQAKCLAHGKRHANSAFRSCIAEAMERVWA